MVGSSAKGISILDQDYYVNPWSQSDKVHLGEQFINPTLTTYLDRSRYIINAIGKGTGSDGHIPGLRELELTQIRWIIRESAPRKFPIRMQASILQAVAQSCFRW